MTTGKEANRSGHKLIDLSHSIEHGMITYKGLPAPIISDHMSREQSHSKFEWFCHGLWTLLGVPRENHHNRHSRIPLTA